MKPYSETAYRMVDGCRQKVKVWRVEESSNPNRRRRTFATKAKAALWILANAKLRHQHGEADFLAYQALKAEERRDVLTARAKLEAGLSSAARKNFTLTSCVELFLKYHSPGDEEITVLEAMGPYIAEKQKTVSEAWGDILAIVLRKFARVLGTMKVHEVTSKMIKTYMDEQEWGVRHFNAMRAAFSEFFTWAAEEDQKYTRAPNPVKAVKRRRKIKGKDKFEKIIVPPPWVRNRLLEVSLQHPQLGMTVYFVLLFYFGCRSSEALEADWIDYNPALDHLAITADQAKKSRPRSIDIGPDIYTYPKALLDQHRPKNGKGRMVPEDYFKRREDICRLAGLEWPRNAGRKAFATFHYLHTKDEGLTRHIISHRGDNATFVNHYKAAHIMENGEERAIMPADIKAYWAVPDFAKKD